MDIHAGGRGSKSQNCLWNTIIGGLTGNVKERPKPTILSDPRPPEEILADELPPVDSPEALVETSFRSDGYEFTLFLLESISF
ncbi:dual specificity calcium/calmodulin-dependent 3',5'-cyclic nucleotide phosphodiesterase 1C-like [Sarcoramphus papa]